MAKLSSVTISSVNSGAKLEFFNLTQDYFSVRFSSPSLSASHRVWIYDRDTHLLVKLFEEMAQNWKGWEGVKIWEAIEGDFGLACTSDRLGHITLKVELVGRRSPESWFAEFNLVLEAGQLDKIATRMAALFREDVG